MCVSPLFKHVVHQSRGERIADELPRPPRKPRPIVCDESRESSGSPTTTASAFQSGTTATPVTPSAAHPSSYPLLRYPLLAPAGRRGSPRARVDSGSGRTTTVIEASVF